MAELYRNRHAGQDVATALWSGKQTLLRRFGPNILLTVAAFQVVGNGSAVIQPPTNPAAKGGKVNLTVTQKTQTLDKIEGYIETRFFNPSAELPAWKESWPEARGWIQASSR